MAKLFPVWSPQKNSIIHNWDSIRYAVFPSRKKLFYKALRNSSACFIKKKEVRDFIFKRDGYKCVICQSVEGLQIDHIISVYACSVGEIPIEALNSENNLQTLCGSCNAAKKPLCQG